MDDQEVADLLRDCEFAMSLAQSALVAFVDRKHSDRVQRDFDRLGEVIRKIKAALVALPPAKPMSPEQEAKVGAFIGAVLDKRFGDGGQEAVDSALADLIEKGATDGK